ncbi:MAG: flagellar biosynthesis anti-sigma factor FlgM [Terriglobales bacterium]|jgi:flagellar biosynthesis anti-sigma factor FlgM
MRIQLNTPDPQSISAEQASKSSTTPVGQTGSAAASDKTSLTQDTVTLSSLATQALAQPEVRQSQVDSLRESIGSGQYKLDPSEIADAILGR